MAQGLLAARGAEEGVQSEGQREKGRQQQSAMQTDLTPVGQVAHHQVRI